MASAQSQLRHRPMQAQTQAREEWTEVWEGSGLGTGAHKRLGTHTVLNKSALLAGHAVVAQLMFSGKQTTAEKLQLIEAEGFNIEPTSWMRPHVLIHAS